MRVEIPENPNCPPSDEMVFQALGESRPVRGILVGPEGREEPCDVIGVEPGGGWVRATARKIADSGAGYAYLITGGLWGIRLRPSAQGSEPWDLGNPRQWGEPYKIYGNAEDILYADA